MDSNDDNDLCRYDKRGICQRLATKEAKNGSHGCSERVRGESQSKNRQPDSEKRKTQKISTNNPFLHRRRTKRLHSQSQKLEATPKKKPAIFVQTMSPRNTRGDSAGDERTPSKKRCEKAMPPRSTPGSKIMDTPESNMEQFREDFKQEYSGEKALEIMEVHEGLLADKDEYYLAKKAGVRALVEAAHQKDLLSDEDVALVGQLMGRLLAMCIATMNSIKRTEKIDFKTRESMCRTLYIHAQMSVVIAGVGYQKNWKVVTKKDAHRYNYRTFEGVVSYYGLPSNSQPPKNKEKGNVENEGVGDGAIENGDVAPVEDGAVAPVQNDVAPLQKDLDWLLRTCTPEKKQCALVTWYMTYEMVGAAITKLMKEPKQVDQKWKLDKGWTDVGTALGRTKADPSKENKALGTYFSQLASDAKKQGVVFGTVYERGVKTKANNEKRGKVKGAALLHAMGTYPKYTVKNTRPVNLWAPNRTKARMHSWEDVIEAKEKEDTKDRMIGWDETIDNDVKKCLETQLWRHRQWYWLERGTYVRFHTPLGIDDCNLWEDGYRPATRQLDPEYEKEDPDYDTDFECDATVEEKWEK